MKIRNQLIDSLLRILKVLEAGVLPMQACALTILPYLAV